MLAALNLPVDDEDNLLHLQGASVSYCIAIGPNHSQKYLSCKPFHRVTKMNMVSWQKQQGNTPGFLSSALRASLTLRIFEFAVPWV
jgi:hypothetical protein